MTQQPTFDPNLVFEYVLVDGELRAYCNDGSTWSRGVERGWKRRAMKKADVSIERWLDARKLYFEQLRADQPWRFGHKKLPTVKQLYKWLNNGICPTPSGHRTDVDGDFQGEPSWIMFLGYV